MGICIWAFAGPNWYLNRKINWLQVWPPSGHWSVRMAQTNIPRQDWRVTCLLTRHWHIGASPAQPLHCPLTPPAATCKWQGEMTAGLQDTEECFYLYVDRHHLLIDQHIRSSFYFYLTKYWKDCAPKKHKFRVPVTVEIGERKDNTEAWEGPRVAVITWQTFLSSRHGTYRTATIKAGYLLW